MNPNKPAGFSAFPITQAVSSQALEEHFLAGKLGFA